jgi:hypothetical protein
MLLVGCTYIGYSLRYFVPESKNKTKKDEEGGEGAKKKDRRPDKDKDKVEGVVDKKIYGYIFFLVFCETISSQLAVMGFALVGSGVSN